MIIETKPIEGGPQDGSVSIVKLTAENESDHRVLTAIEGLARDGGKMTITTAIGLEVVATTHGGPPEKE